MAKASLAPVSLAPHHVDEEIINATLARGGPRFLQVLKQAAWEMWRSRLAAIGTIMLLSLFLVAILAPAIARYDPVKQNYREMLQGPSAAHYFGTDKFGRDI